LYLSNPKAGMQRFLIDKGVRSLHFYLLVALIHKDMLVHRCLGICRQEEVQNQERDRRELLG
jgi:hypothetical protein